MAFSGLVRGLGTLLYKIDSPEVCSTRLYGFINDLSPESLDVKYDSRTRTSSAIVGFIITDEHSAGDVNCSRAFLPASGTFETSDAGRAADAVRARFVGRSADPLLVRLCFVWPISQPKSRSRQNLHGWPEIST